METFLSNSMENKAKALYEQVEWLVCDYTELDKDSVLQCNREECVDARYILVSVACEYLTDDEVSRYSGLTRACVNKIRNGVKHKLRRYSFRCMHESVKETIKEWAFP